MRVERREDVIAVEQNCFRDRLHATQTTTTAFVRGGKDSQETGQIEWSPLSARISCLRNVCTHVKRA